MLDLNLGIISSSDSSCEENKYTNHKKKHVLSEGGEVEEKRKSPTSMEESATSNSSIVNNSEEAITTPGDENSSNDDPKSKASPFVFHILKKDASFREKKLREGLILRELFPERSGSLELNLRPCLGVTSTQQRLGLPQEANNVNNKEVELRIVQEKKQQARKSRRGPRSRSSQYRGVTFYRRTGRWESHIWDCGKQVYLGGFDTAHAAARAYDRAAIKFRGVEADINFNLSDYDEELKQMKCLSKEEFVHVLRRQCTGLSRGSLKFKGSALHGNGRWESWMGLFPGRAYDNTAINCNGREAASNFEHQIFEGQNNLVPSNGGSGCNLDLSLRISLPSNDRNTNQDRIATASSTMQTMHGLPPIYDNNPKWTGLLPGSLLNYEERNKDKGVEI